MPVDMFNSTSSKSTTIGREAGISNSPTSNPSSDNNLSFDNLARTYQIHNQMIKISESADVAFQPIFLIQIPRAYDISPNSARSLNYIAYESYDRAERQLELLALAPNEKKVIEEGAVRSAMTILGHLKASVFPPPALSWHGGDAVVMLWSLQDTTCSITITDGEIGYVVRRNRKLIRIEDSIDIQSFIISDASLPCLIR